MSVAEFVPEWGSCKRPSQLKSFCQRLTSQTSRPQEHWPLEPTPPRRPQCSQFPEAEVTDFRKSSPIKHNQTMYSSDVSKCFKCIEALWISSTNNGETVWIAAACLRFDPWMSKRIWMDLSCYSCHSFCLAGGLCWCPNFAQVIWIIFPFPPPVGSGWGRVILDLSQGNTTQENGSLQSCSLRTLHSKPTSDRLEHHRWHIKSIQT